LYKKRGKDESFKYRQAYKRNGIEEPNLPLNSEVDIFPNFYDVMRQRGIRYSPKLDRPYWNPSKRYDPIEIFTTAIQFLDDHNEPLPATTLPPPDNVREYSNIVLSSEKKINVTEQFQLLLDVTDNNVVGAANLGFISSRFYARGGDRRAYPELNVTPDDLVAWNNKIAQFETFNDMGTSDGPGDTYYFWTHFFVSSAYRSLDCMSGNIIDPAFEIGTGVMTQVRKNIAGQPTISDHREASMLGRNIGIACIETIREEAFEKNGIVSEKERKCSTRMPLRRKGLNALSGD
jgi:hypothetical protein